MYKEDLALNTPPKLISQLKQRYQSKPSNKTIRPIDDILSCITKQRVDLGVMATKG